MTDPDLLNPGSWVFADSRGVPVPGFNVTSVKLRREPEKASGIGDIACTLNKVLPADTGPLVAPWWICPHLRPGASGRTACHLRLGQPGLPARVASLCVS